LQTYVSFEQIAPGTDCKRLTISSAAARDDAFADAKQAN
jgi:hypothetical protein